MFAQHAQFDPAGRCHYTIHKQNTFLESAVPVYSGIFFFQANVIEINLGMLA